MKHIKFTYVDSKTGISVASHPAINGPAFPVVDGLVFEWARESAYPTPIPEFFGTCSDTAFTMMDGVIDVLSQYDYDNMRADEMRMRQPILTPNEAANAAINAKIDALERASMLNKGSREMEIYLLEKEAREYSATYGLTEEQILSGNVYYPKLKALDADARALERQLT